MKDAENKFIKFLEEKKVLEEFKASLKNTRGFDDPKVWLKSVNPSHCISLAFYWGHAGEWGKWSAINNEWQDFIKQDGAK